MTNCVIDLGDYGVEPGKNISDIFNSAISVISKVGKGEILIPEGNFIIDGFKFPKFVNVRGMGFGYTTLLMSDKLPDGSINDNFAFSVDHGMYNRFSDLTIDANLNARSTLLNKGLTHTISIAYTQYFSIKSVELLNATNASMAIYRSSKGKIEKNYIKNSGSNGILLMMDCADIDIIENDIDTTLNQNGIFCMRQNGVACRNINIVRNKVRNAADYGIEVGHTDLKDGDPDHEFVTVAENYVENSVNAAYGFRSVSDSNLKDNIAKGFGKNGGYGSDGIFIEGIVGFSKNNSVENNKIYQINKTGNSNGLYATGVKDSHFNGNKFFNCMGSGMMFEASLGNKTTAYPDSRRIYTDINIERNLSFENDNDGFHLRGYNANDISMVENRSVQNSLNGFEIANLNLCHGLDMIRNIAKENGKTGIIYSNQDGVNSNGNKYVNNSEQGTNASEMSAISVSGSGIYEFEKEYFKDDRETPMQKYYISSYDNDKGSITLRNKRIAGGTTKKQTTETYSEE